MNIPQASAEAVQMLQYMNNFVAGVFTVSEALFPSCRG
jgi:hypothetical protein